MASGVREMKQSWIKAAEVIARGGSDSEAGKAAAVSGRTVRRWRADEVEFANRVETFRSEMFNEAAGRLAAIVVMAVAKLGEIIENGEERHQLAASRAALEYGSRYRIDQQLENRISDLEIAAGLRHGGTQ